MQAIQTTVVEFPVHVTQKDAWEAGNQLLGKPVTARLTSYSQMQFLDVYYS